MRAGGGQPSPAFALPCGAAPQIERQEGTALSETGSLPGSGACPWSLSGMPTEAFFPG